MVGEILYKCALTIMTVCEKTSSAESAAKRILKSARKKFRKRGYVPPFFHGMFEYNGKFVICDCYRMVRFNNDIASLPRADYKKRFSASLENVMNKINLAKKEGETLNLPDVKTLKAFLIKQKFVMPPYGRAQRKNHACCIDNYIWVNAKELIDILEALPGCIAYKPNKPTEAIYFKAENGDGILLPFCPPQKTSEILKGDD